MIPQKQIPTTAFVVEKPGAPFVLQDVILDEVRANEVLVEMKYTGLCHTDIVVQQGIIPVGDYPAVLGHEGAGIVRRVGSGVKDKSLQEGDLVFLSFSSCKGQSCTPCQEGRSGFCGQITPINFAGARGLSATESPISFPGGKGPIRGQFFGQSSMSKLAVVDERSVVRSPSGSGITIEDMAVLAPLGCGYLTGAGTVFNVLKPKPSSRFAVLGMGAVGLAAMMAARSLGVETVIAVDIVDAKLELAKSLGASHTLNTKTVSDLAQGLLDMFPDGVDCIIDTTGVVPLLDAAVKALAHEGTLAVVGVARAGSILSIDPLALMMGCKRVVGVIEGCADPAVIVPQLIDLYKQGKFPVDKLSKLYSPAELEQALADLHTGTVIKPVIKWEDL
ncbi:Polyketide synthase enoylreductase [Penicillium bovifimosum]|uniref:Polyketide synthase enoylreductase n=1 Tax=Penicillium bovifimosum TaxID=126998 RepID=A0A9W9H4G2_9EURO|nr:Polyketide synthase enoylreductase [Penicillium bovifimosum]KAJ5138487.1 Polyketide synthase enoylreductase [Penicillium bovifimosum]